jgi:hypothetical protein
LTLFAGLLQHGNQMAWVRRRNQRYYYHAVCRDGRSVQVYVGRGPVAELIAAHVERAKVERQAAREAVESARRELAPLEAMMDQLGRGCDELVEAGLRSLGYYRCCGHWRGRRRVKALDRAGVSVGG